MVIGGGEEGALHLADNQMNRNGPNMPPRRLGVAMILQTTMNIDRQ